MKKFIFIILLGSLCFGKWVMIEGNNPYLPSSVADRILYIYNDETGTVYFKSNFGDENSTTPAFQKMDYMKFLKNKVVLVGNPPIK